MSSFYFGVAQHFFTPVVEALKMDYINYIIIDEDGGYKHEARHFQLVVIIFKERKCAQSRHKNR